jgi:hypothetical protein
MILIYFAGFFLMVSIYAIITNRLNEKAKCDHSWDDRGDDGIKCAKCNKSLKKIYRDEHMAA